MIILRNLYEFYINIINKAKKPLNNYLGYIFDIIFLNVKTKNTL